MAVTGFVFAYPVGPQLARTIASETLFSGSSAAGHPSRV